MCVSKRRVVLLWLPYLPLSGAPLHLPQPGREQYMLRSAAGEELSEQAQDMRERVGALFRFTYRRGFVPRRVPPPSAPAATHSATDSQNNYYQHPHTTLLHIITKPFLPDNL